MAEDSIFAQEIDRRLDDAQKRRSERQQQMRDHMTELSAGSRKFAKVAAHIMDAVIKPNLQQLVKRFDNARLLDDADAVHPHHCTCSFNRTDRYPATVHLELGVGHDEDIKHVTLFYALSIIPVFLDFERKGDIRFPIDGLNESRLTAWVEEKLLTFLDTYLSLEHIEQYQRENLTVDPVCGMTINKAMAVASAEHNGVMYHFCVQGCCDRFIADPDCFLKLPDSLE